MRKPVGFLWAGLVAAAAIAVLIHFLWKGWQGVVAPEDLTLAPAPIPNRDGGDLEGIILDGGGERVVIDRETRKVARTSPDGGTRWETLLGGDIGGVRPPHVVADGDRVYVSNDGGVTALDVRTGQTAWHSTGVNHRLLVHCHTYNLG